MATTARPSKLHWFPRAVAALLGLAGLAAGGIGVFTITRDFGPIALLALGSLFLLVSFVGRVFNLKWNDSELVWPEAEVAEVIARHAEHLPKEEQQQLVEELTRVAPGAGDRVRQALKKESEILEALSSALPAGVRLLPEVQGEHVTLDGVLQDEDGKKVLVEVRGTGHIPDAIADAVRDAQTKDPSVAGGLLLVARSTPRRRRAEYEEKGWTVHDFGEDALKKAVTTAFAGNQAIAGSKESRTGTD